MEKSEIDRPSSIFQMTSYEQAEAVGQQERVEIEDKLNVYWHWHALAKNDEDNGWRCDGIKNFTVCMSGITEFNQTKGMERWRCEICDFDLCRKCIQTTNAVHDRMKKENEKRAYIETIAWCYETYYSHMKEIPPLNKEQLVDYLSDSDYHLTPIGITNAGKSSTINELCGNYLLNTHELRETTCIWKINYVKPNLNLDLKQYKMQVKTRDQDGIKSKKEEDSFDTLDKLKQAVQRYSLQRFLPDDQPPKQIQVDQIYLTLPNSDNKILESQQLEIIDMPGIEDAVWFKEIQSYIHKRKQSIMPMFVIDLTQGSFDLIQFNPIKEIFKHEKNLRFPFVFTKLKGLMNDISSELADDDLDQDEYDRIMLEKIQETLLVFKNGIEKVFKNTAYFIYDSNVEGYYVNSNLEVFNNDLSEVEENSDGDVYAVDQSIGRIREFVRHQFEDNVNWTSLRVKLKKLYDDCKVPLFEIMKKALNKEDIQSILDKRIDFLKLLHTKHQEFQAREVDELFVKLPQFIEEIILQMCNNSIKKSLNEVQFKLQIKYELSKLVQMMEKSFEPPEIMIKLFFWSSIYLYKKIPYKLTKQIRHMLLYIPKELLQPDSRDAKTIAQSICSQSFIAKLKAAINKKLESLNNQEFEQAHTQCFDFFSQDLQGEPDHKIIEFADKAYDVNAKSAAECLKFLKAQCKMEGEEELKVEDFIPK